MGISVSLWAARKQTPAAEAARRNPDAAHQRVDDLAARLTAEVHAAAAALQALGDRILLTADEIITLAEARVCPRSNAIKSAPWSSARCWTRKTTYSARSSDWRGLIADYGAGWGDLAALVGEEWYR